jgi:Methyltransferase domain
MDHSTSRYAAHYLSKGIQNVEGWLSPVTAAIMTAIAGYQSAIGIGGDLAEIGIHHGKSFLAFANNTQPRERLHAIDVFEDQHKNIDHSGNGSKPQFLRNAKLYAPHAHIEIMQESSLDLPRLGWPTAHADKIRFFSIDGSHTRAATFNDLRIAERTTVADGVVFLDDILSSHWLGVISGLFDYLTAGGGLVPLAIIPNKLVLVRRPDCVGQYKGFLRSLCGSAVSKADVEFLDFHIDAIDEDSTILERVIAGL